MLPETVFYHQGNLNGMLMLGTKGSGLLQIIGSSLKTLSYHTGASGFAYFPLEKGERGIIGVWYFPDPSSLKLKYGFVLEVCWAADSPQLLPGMWVPNNPDRLLDFYYDTTKEEYVARVVIHNRAYSITDPAKQKWTNQLFMCVDGKIDHPPDSV